ncbi:PREDICTED: 28S ribosomal protein S6, mitochondrial [Chlamydotis macqueenii]|uniref:28S ribosomal protein S6, mitochondrial n=1 Tax=Chlamydotis macqueenii TaxID=187382 RepID=UPI0005299BE9|nr:PREDICTED: 28S ribosomal protein S6, mitochondrial [Chlamydotis macqueenii]
MNVVLIVVSVASHRLVFPPTLFTLSVVVNDTNEHQRYRDLKTIANSLFAMYIYLHLYKGQPKCYQPETAAVLKRTVEALMERGAIVRNLENLGERSLPYKISKHKERHRRGGYFLIDLEGPPSIVSTMMDHLGRDIDVIRRAFVKHPVSKTEECSGIIPVNYEDKLMVKK